MSGWIDVPSWPCWACEAPIPPGDEVWVRPETGSAVPAPAGEPFHTMCAPPQGAEEEVS